MTRVLVVDDEPEMLRSVERILRSEYDVHAFASPKEAAASAPGIRADVALIDVRMPEMDGFELMAELRGQDPDLRVVLMTGSIHELDEKLVRSLQEGAFYYINKPFDRDVLLALLSRAAEVRRLERSDRERTRHLEVQIDEARFFQETMLPAPEAEVEGFRVRAELRPSVELAGDLYDYAPAGPGRVAVLVADVVGHGASAAMLTVVVKSAFHRAGESDFDPMVVVRNVAEQVRAFPPDRFVTLFAARLSRETIEWVNAGHEGAILWRAEGEVEALDSTGPIVSPALPPEWEKKARSSEEGDGLLLFTDGITETFRGDEMFGMERLLAVVRDGSPDDLPARVFRDVESFADGPAMDDRTLLLVTESRRPGEGSPGRA